MSLSPVYVWLIRIFLGTSLVASLAWIIEYSRQGAWHNIIGRNLLVKTLIIAGLLAISLAAVVFRLSPLVLEILRWIDLVFVAAVGPVMVWRMLLFRRVSGAQVKCPAGHLASAAAKYCPACGLLIPPGSPVADS